MSTFITFNSEDDLRAYLSRPESEYASEYGKFDFEQCNFNFEVSFKRLLREFNGIAVFKNARFSNTVSFEDVDFRKIADFNGCNFYNATIAAEPFNEWNIRYEALIEQLKEGFISL